MKEENKKKIEKICLGSKFSFKIFEKFTKRFIGLNNIQYLFMTAKTAMSRNEPYSIKMQIIVEFKANLFLARLPLNSRV